MSQLHVSGGQFYCLLRCDLYQTLEGTFYICFFLMFQYWNGADKRSSPSCTKWPSCLTCAVLWIQMAWRKTEPAKASTTMIFNIFFRNNTVATPRGVKLISKFLSEVPIRYAYRAGRHEGYITSICSYCLDKCMIPTGGNNCCRTDTRLWWNENA